MILAGPRLGFAFRRKDSDRAFAVAVLAFGVSSIWYRRAVSGAVDGGSRLFLLGGCLLGHPKQLVGDVGGETARKTDVPRIAQQCRLASRHRRGHG